MSTNITNVIESTLVEDQSSPVRTTFVMSTVLVVTERPVGPNAVDITAVTESALIQEPESSPHISQVLEQVLLQIEAAPSAENVDVGGTISSTLIVEQSGPTDVTGVNQALLVQVEGPVIEVRAKAIHQFALAADLSRGTLLASSIHQQSLYRTEPKSRDPERAKIVTKNIALQATYLNPIKVQSNSNLKVAAKFFAASKPAVDPSTIMSNTRLEQTFKSIAVRQAFLAPDDVRQLTPAQQLFNLIAVNTQKSDPLDIAAPYTSQHIRLDIALPTQYPNGNVIMSHSRLYNASFMTAAGMQYPDPPRSLEQMDAIKVDIAHNGSYMDPADLSFRPLNRLQQSTVYSAHTIEMPYPELKSNIRLHVAKTEVIHMRDAMVNPNTITSQIVRRAVKSEMIHSPNEPYRDPKGEKPSGRLITVTVTTVNGSTNYNQLPTSKSSTARVETQIVCNAQSDNPELIDWSHQTYAISVMSATAASYSAPDVVFAKRRTNAIVAYRQS